MAFIAGPITLIQQPSTPPDGQYEGVWAGYQVAFIHGNAWYQATTNDHSPGPNETTPCVITIKGNRATVEPK